MAYIRGFVIMIMKRDLILKELRWSITTGKFPPGSKLPKEFELASQFGVARDTVRDSLKILEEDGLIERIKSKGTFVRPPLTKERMEKVISFLIPYPQYMQGNSFQSFRAVMNVFHGAVRAAAEEGWRVQPLPFSRSLTGNDKDIDWEALDFLGRDSRLIVYGIWYRNAFEYFLKREVRVGQLRMIDNDVTTSMDSYFKSWIGVSFNLKAAMKKVIKLLHQRGCRRILFGGLFLNDPFNMFHLGYREAMAELGLPVMEFSLEANVHFHETAQKIKQLYRDLKFDALIPVFSEPFLLHTYDFYQALGLPDSVRLVMFRDEIKYLSSRPQISTLLPDDDDAGYLIAKALIQDAYQPKTIPFEPVLIDRESTGGTYVQPIAASAYNEALSIVF